MSYFIQLKDQNHRIQQLLKSINAYHFNVHHLETMMEAYSQKEATLRIHMDIWEREYVPAIDCRQSLRNELYLAQHQEQLFHKNLMEKIHTLSDSDIELDISYMRRKCETNTAYLSLMKDLSYTTTAATSAATSSTSTSPNASTLTLPEEEAKCSVKERKISYMWTLASATSVLNQLESENAEIQTTMRGIASRSCALTVKLKAIEDEIFALGAAMSIAAESLYSEVEAELLPLKINYYTTVLTYRRSIAVKPRTLAPTRSSHNYPVHFCLEARQSEESVVPTWATTVANSVIDSTIIASDFGFNSDELFSALDANIGF